MKLRSIQRTQVNLSFLPEKQDHVSIAEFLIRNLKSQIAELVRRARTMLKNKFLYEWWNTYSFIDQGGIIWDRGGNFSKLIDRESHRGTSHQGAWTGCVNYFHKTLHLGCLTLFWICICTLNTDAVNFCTVLATNAVQKKLCSNCQMKQLTSATIYHKYPVVNLVIWSL